MKRSVLTIMAILAMVSCNKTELDSNPTGKSIDFSTGVMTKATLYNEESEIRGSAIGVYGAISGGETIFNNQTLSYTDGAWSYDINNSVAGNQYNYWANGNLYYFAGVWPQTNNASFSNSGVLTLNCTSGESLSSIDRMYAVASRDLTQVPIVAGDYSAVPLEFKHAFAAVQFKIVNISGSTVTNVKTPQLKNLKNKGTLTVDAKGVATWDLQTSTVTGSEYSETTTNISSMASDATNVLDLYSSANSTILVLPQAVLGTNISLAFTYTKSNKATTSTLSLKDATAIDQWEAGKIYTYTATIKTNNITFSVDIRDWITEEYLLK